MKHARSEFRDRVSAALHDLDYFGRFPPLQPKNRKMKEERLCLRKLLRENTHLESVRDLGDYGYWAVMAEALRQIEHERATRSAALLTPASSTASAPHEDADQDCQEPTTVADFIPEAKVPPLDARLPISVPFMAQHHILVALQSTAEAVCFAVAQAHLPSLLSERKWDCPEAASLPTWLEAINGCPDGPAHSILSLHDGNVHSVLALHEAVADRSRVSYEALRQSVAAVFNLMRLLDAGMLAPIMPYFHNMCTVLETLSVRAEEMNTIVNTQLGKLDKTMDRIAHRRAVLDGEEAAARKHARDAMAEYEAEWDAEYRAAFNARQTPE